MKVEQRQSGRTQQRLKVKFADEDEFITAFTVDLGVGGLFLKTNHILNVGDTLYLEFNLPDTEDSVEAEAQVRWVRLRGGDDDGMGVKFISLRQDDFKKIAAYLDNLGILPGKNMGPPSSP